MAFLEAQAAPARSGACGCPLSQPCLTISESYEFSSEKYDVGLEVAVGLEREA